MLVSVYIYVFVLLGLLRDEGASPESFVKACEKVGSEIFLVQLLLSMTSFEEFKVTRRAKILHTTATQRPSRDHISSAGQIELDG